MIYINDLPKISLLVLKWGSTDKLLSPPFNIIFLTENGDVRKTIHNRLMYIDILVPHKEKGKLWIISNYNMIY